MCARPRNICPASVVFKSRASRCLRTVETRWSASGLSRPTCGRGSCDETVRLQEQPLRVLAMLLERPGEEVIREELHGRLWNSDTFVDRESHCFFYV